MPHLRGVSDTSHLPLTDADAARIRDELSALLRSEGWRIYAAYQEAIIASLDAQLDTLMDPVQIARAAAARVQAKATLAWPTLQATTLAQQLSPPSNPRKE